MTRKCFGNNMFGLRWLPGNTYINLGLHGDGDLGLGLQVVDGDFLANDREGHG
jgi:hypothetical protein